MPIIVKNNIITGEQVAKTKEPIQTKQPTSQIKKDGVDLIVNGKQKKMYKTSAYLLDMMSDDIDN
jgi:hypothetical protein